MQITLLLLLASSSYTCSYTCGLTKTQRDTRCQTEQAKCVWLNEHYSRPHGLPIHDSVDNGFFHIFCHDGFLANNIRALVHIWDTLRITMETSMPRTLALSSGNSSQMIVSGRGSPRNISSPLLLSPFGVQCVGVTRVASGTTYFSVDVKLELWMPYPMLLAFGLTLLFLAPRLSRNVPLIYSTGITIGILASFVVLLYILSRYLPGKSFMGLGFLAGGYTVVGGILYWFYSNLTDIFQEYWNYVLIYGVVAGLISFATIYRWGGVSNPRTFDLIQWFMQLIGVFLVYSSMPFNEASVVMVLIALLFYKIPIRWNPLTVPFLLLFRLLEIAFCLCLRGVRHPLPRRSLMSVKEYEEQGRVETDKELKKLKQYCGSQRKATAKLGNTARNRLRDFVSGVEDHVTSDEKVLHWWTFSADDDDSAPSEESSSPISPNSSPPSYSLHHSYTGSST